MKHLSVVYINCCCALLRWIWTRRKRWTLNSDMDADTFCVHCEREHAIIDKWNDLCVSCGDEGPFADAFVRTTGGISQTVTRTERRRSTQFYRHSHWMQNSIRDKVQWRFGATVYVMRRNRWPNGMAHNMQMWLKVIQGDNKENLDTICDQAIRSILKAFEKPFLCSDTNPVEILEILFFRLPTRPSIFRLGVQNSSSLDGMANRESGEQKKNNRKQTNWNVRLQMHTRRSLSWCGLRFRILHCGESTAAARTLLRRVVPFHRVFSRSFGITSLTCMCNAFGEKWVLRRPRRERNEASGKGDSGHRHRHRLTSHRHD